METELWKQSYENRVIVCQTNFLLWVPPFLSYELWKQRIELSKNPIQTGSNCPCFIIIIKKEFIFPYKTKYYPCFIGQYLLRFCPKNNTNKTTYYIDLIYCDLWYIKRAGF